MKNNPPAKQPTLPAAGGSNIKNEPPKVAADGPNIKNEPPKVAAGESSVKSEPPKERRGSGIKYEISEVTDDGTIIKKKPPQVKPPESGIPKEPPKVKPPESGIPKEPPKVKPPESSIPKEPPKVKPPESGIPKEPPKVKPPESGIPKEPPKVKPPESGIPTEPPKVKPPESGIPKEPPKVKPPESGIPKEPPKVKPPESGIPKEPPKVKPPESVIPKEPPKVKPPESGIPKEPPKVKPPESGIPKEPPKVKPPESGLIKEPPKAPHRESVINNEPPTVTPRKSRIQSELPKVTPLESGGKHEPPNVSSSDSDDENEQPKVAAGRGSTKNEPSKGTPLASGFNNERSKGTSTKKKRPEVKAEKSKPSKSRRLKLRTNDCLVNCFMVAVLIGVVLGMILQSMWLEHDDEDILYLEFPGVLFVNMLKMLIIPLVTSTIISGMTSLEIPSSGRMIASIVAYHIVTMFMAAALGFIFMLAMSYGETAGDATYSTPKTMTIEDHLTTLLDLLRWVADDVTAFREVKTAPHWKTINNATYRVPEQEFVMTTYVTVRGINVLGLVITSLACGYIINHLHIDGHALKMFFVSMNSAMMVILNIVLWYTPVYLVFLSASKMATVRDIKDTVNSIGHYILLVLGGLVVHGLIDLPVVYYMVTGKSPRQFASSVTKALATAWFTDSSTAALPVIIHCLIDNSKLNQSIVEFMVPLSITFNMDGIILYETLWCIYLAHYNGLEMGMVDVVFVSLTTSLSNVWINTLPQTGLVIAVAVLTIMGFPTEHLTLIVSVEWFLDRFKTVVSVWGTCVGTAVIDHYFKDLKRLTLEQSDLGRHKGLSTEQSTTNASVTAATSDVSVVSEMSKASRRTRFAVYCWAVISASLCPTYRNEEQPQSETMPDKNEPSNKRNQ